MYGKTLEYVENLVSKLPGTNIRLGFVSPQCGSYCFVNLERRSNHLHHDTDDNPLAQPEGSMHRREANNNSAFTSSRQPIYRSSPSPPCHHLSPYSSAPMQDWMYTPGTVYSPPQIPPALAESESPVVPIQAHKQDHIFHAAQTPLLEHEPADMDGLASNRDCSTPTTDILCGLTPGLCTYCGAAPGSLQMGGGLRQFRRCKRCKSADYCSEKCQRKDWKAGHKQKCMEAPAQPAPPLSSDTIIAEHSVKATHNGVSGPQASRSPPLPPCPKPCFQCGAAWGSVDRRGKPRQFRCCPRCKIAEYCSDKCQQSHWTAKHEKECPDAVEIPSENRRGSLTPQTSPAVVSDSHNQRYSPSPPHQPIAVNMALESQPAFLRAHAPAHAADVSPLAQPFAAAYGVRRDVPDLWAQQLHNAVFPNFDTAPLQQGPGQDAAYSNPFGPTPPNILCPPAVSRLREFLALHCLLLRIDCSFWYAVYELPPLICKLSSRPLCASFEPRQTAAQMRLRPTSNPYIWLQRGMQSLGIAARRAHLCLDLSAHIIPTTLAPRALGIVLARKNYLRHTHSSQTQTQQQPQAQTNAQIQTDAE